MTDLRPTLAQPVLGPAYTGSPPIIDGVISPGEWDDADTESIDFGVPRNGMIYVMNDADNLYIAVWVEDNDADSGDKVSIYFDNDHSGTTSVVGDDGITFDIPWFLDLYFGGLGFGTDHPAGTIDGSGARTQDANLDWFFEFSHPLDSDDDAYDFSLSYLDTVGFTLDYLDKLGVSGQHYFWPSHPTQDPVNEWGDIVIAFPGRFSVEQDGSPVSLIEVSVCSEFILEFWIRDIPDGYGLVAFDFDVYYDPNLMELVDDQVFFPPGHNWDSAGAGYWIEQDWARYSPHGIWGWFEGADPEPTPEEDDFLAATATFHCKGESFGSEIRVSAGQETLTYRNLETGEETEVYPSDYVVICNQYQPRQPPSQPPRSYPVGGELFTSNKLAIVAPYLGLIGIIGASLSIYISRKRWRT